MRAIRLVVALLVVAAAAVPAAAAEGDKARSADHVRVAGDLDADGLPDTVGLEWNPPEHNTPVAGIGGGETVLTARRGSNGTVLWSRQVPGDLVLPAKIGPDGGAGLLVVNGPVVNGYPLTGTYTVSSMGAGGGIAVDGRPLVLTALDGASGATAWTRTFDGAAMAGAAFEAGTAGSGQAIVAEQYAAFVDAVGGGTADHFLVTVITRKDTPAGISSTNTAVVVNGADGTDTSTTALVSEDTRPIVRAAGDVDGDGLGDFAFLRTAAGQGVAVHSGATGQRVWNNPDVPVGDFAVMERVGDLDSDDHDDIIVSGDTGATPATSTHLLDGATGAVRVATPASSLVPVGDITGDGRSELVASTSGSDSVAYQLLDVDGSVITARSHPVAAPEGATNVAIGSATEIGDVNDDGITDLAHTVTYSRNQDSASYQTLVSGRTLTILRSPAKGAPLVRAGGKATGEFLEAGLEGGRVGISMYDGLSGATAWTVTFDTFLAGATVAQLHAAAADLTGDGVLDVIANVQLTKPGCVAIDVPNAGCLGGSTSQGAVRTFVLSGADGALHWQS